ncbi:MAG: ATP-binding protein, partial [Chloroflexota bacterium]
ILSQFNDPSFQIIYSFKAAISSPISFMRRLFFGDIRFRLLNLHVFLAIIVIAIVLFFFGQARDRLERDILRSDVALAQALALQIDRQDQPLVETSQNITGWMELVLGEQVAVITIIDQKNNNVFHLEDNAKLLQNNDWQNWSSWQRKVIDTAYQDKVGSFNSMAPDGELWIHSFASTPISDSRVVIQRPTSEAFATLTLIYEILMTALLLYTFVIIIFWVRLSNTIITPLQTLESFSAKITGREILTSDVDLERAAMRLTARDDQVGRLANALSEMGRQYLITDDQLDKQTGQLQSILESMDAGLVLENLHGAILYCNRQASNWLNARETDLVGRNTIDEIPRLTGHRQNRQLEAFLNRTGEETLELSRKLPDGKAQDLNMQRFDVCDSRGNIIGSGHIWQDVTNYREMDRMKSALISTVSHELRTPLTSIIGYSESLLDREIEWNAQKRNRFIWRINSEASRLKSLIESLLDFTRLEGGRIEFVTRPCDLNAIIIKVLDSMEIDQSVRFELDLHNKLPAVNGDRERLRTVVRNLMENALKYGDPFKQILISTNWEADSGLVQLSVKDGGTSLQNADNKRIFEPFFRIDSGYSRSSGGVGLGLAICKGFIDAHGGEIDFISDETGTTFSFTLPVVFENRESVLAKTIVGYQAKS